MISIRKILWSPLAPMLIGVGLLVPVTMLGKQTPPTADQAKNNTSDRELARNIRRDVVKDKTLSTYGHNVKIIAEEGKVTLKGPVHSDEEKHRIVEIAQRYAGAGNVVDQLTVNTENK